MEAISEKIRYSLSYRIRDTSQNHTPGEKGFVDWAGRTIPIQDPVTGEVRGAALFVMVLGASSYTYAEATLDQQLAAWLGCHIHAFEYLGRAEAAGSR